MKYVSDMNDHYMAQRSNKPKSNFGTTTAHTSNGESLNPTQMDT